MRGFTILFLTLGWVACTNSRDDKSVGTGSSPVGANNVGSVASRPRTTQVTPPFDIKAPPADATKTASGLVYKKSVTNEAGVAPKRNDTILINYTGWRQGTGETFFTSRAVGQPWPLNLTKQAPGFVEAMQLLHKGEKAMLWVPPAIGYKTPPTQGTPETLVYEVEIVDVTPAPAIPDNVGKPPDSATALPSGTKFVIVRPGSGKDKARQFDTVTYDYTAWDSEGRMVDSTEVNKTEANPRTVNSPPYKQSLGMFEMLTQLTAGARGRFWIDSERLKTDGQLPPGIPKGLVCYEIDLQQIVKPEHEPPPPPPDVAKPPGGVNKTAKGVFYRLLKSGSGTDVRHPSENDSVKVHYTGWTTEGKMFDSSELRGSPATFSLHGVIQGWTEGIPVLAIGDRARFWIPVELAYKNQPGKPAGMLVFEVELLEIVKPTAH